MSLEVKNVTITLTNEAFTMPSGARTIDLNNVGGADGSFKGSGKIKNRPSTFVQLKAGTSYSYPDLGQPHGEVVIDATGTIIDVSANY